MLQEPSSIKSLTAEIIRTGRRPLLITGEEDLRRRSTTHRRIPRCPIAKIWLGGPSQIADGLNGVMAIQSYTDPDLYDQTDVEVMVSGQSRSRLLISANVGKRICPRVPPISRVSFAVHLSASE